MRAATVRSTGVPSARRAGEVETANPAETKARTAFRRAAVGSVVTAAAYSVLLLCPFVLSEAQRARLSDVILVPLAGWLVVSALSAVRRSTGRSRHGWRLLVLAGVLFTVAEAAWTWDRLMDPGGDRLSLADPFYLLAIIPAALMLLGVIPRDIGPERARQLVGSVVIAGSVFYLVASFAPESVIFSRDVPPLTAAVWLAYPITDVVLASLALIALTRRGGSGRLPLVLLAGGFLSFAAADTAYAAVAPTAGYLAGSAVDLGWAFGFLFMALAARSPSAPQMFKRPAKPVEFERAGSARSLLIYVPLLSGVVVLAAYGTPGVLLPTTLVVVFLLFGLRQALLAREAAVLRVAVEARVEELKAASSTLAHLAQQHERTIESVSDGIFGVDARARVTFANAAALEMLGWEALDVVGARPEETFLAERIDAFGAPTEDPIAKALRTRQPSGALAAVFNRPDGTTFPIEWSAGPLVSDGGATLGAVVVFRDITKRREVERIKDEFVSVVSHELRTPLTSVRGALGLLAGGAMGPLNTKAAALARRGLDGAERLTRLVDDLLDVDRIESGATTMEVAPCSPAELIAEAADGVGPMAALREVVVLVGATDGTVHADAHRVVQALTNLLSNAIKFSRPHGTITVSSATSGDMVEFAVADEGRGIPADMLERIFERFKQVDSSDSRLYGGTGLGLAICRTIVLRHGGEIWAESEPERGATFRFTIPMAAAGAERSVDDARVLTSP